MMKRALLLSILFLNFVFSSVFSMYKTKKEEVGYFTSEFSEIVSVKDEKIRKGILERERQAPGRLLKLKNLLQELDKINDLIKNELFVYELMVCFSGVMGVLYEKIDKWPDFFAEDSFSNIYTKDSEKYFLEKINNLYKDFMLLLYLTKNNLSYQQALKWITIFVNGCPDKNFIVLSNKLGITPEKCTYSIRQKKNAIAQYCKALKALGKELDLSEMFVALDITNPYTKN